MAIMDAAPINALRTAAVSVIALRNLKPRFKTIVIFGAGLIGTEHLRQILQAHKLNHFPRLSEIKVYDTEASKRVQLAKVYRGVAAKQEINLLSVGSLKECFMDETAVIIATNALQPYLGKETVEDKKDLAVVHVSLRDYYPDALTLFDNIVVDSWEHVAREGTSIDLAYNKGLINQSSCLELIKRLSENSGEIVEGNMIFNPMGISVTDITIGLIAYREAITKGIGVRLS